MLGFTVLTIPHRHPHPHHPPPHSQTIPNAICLHPPVSSARVNVEHALEETAYLMLLHLRNWRREIRRHTQEFDDRCTLERICQKERNSNDAHHKRGSLE